MPGRAEVYRTGSLAASRDSRPRGIYLVLGSGSDGNTLICEGCDGRIFEVTVDGQVVWEYVNPHVFVETGRPGLNNWVFRAFRYSLDDIERARRA